MSSQEEEHNSVEPFLQSSSSQRQHPNFESISSTKKWHPHLYLIYYFIIFFSGISFAVLFLYLLNRWPPPYHQQQQQLHNIPQEKYLQVRDEFPIVSPYLYNSISSKTKSKGPPNEGITHHD